MKPRAKPAGTKAKRKSPPIGATKKQLKESLPNSDPTTAIPPRIQLSWRLPFLTPTPGAQSVESPDDGSWQCEDWDGERHIFEDDLPQTIFRLSGHLLWGTLGFSALFAILYGGLNGVPMPRCYPGSVVGMRIGPFRLRICGGFYRKD